MQGWRGMTMNQMTTDEALAKIRQYEQILEDYPLSPLWIRLAFLKEYVASLEVMTNE